MDSWRAGESHSACRGGSETRICHDSRYDEGRAVKYHAGIAVPQCTRVLAVPAVPWDAVDYRSQTVERRQGIDLIRFVGVAIIMVAHAGPPDWLFHLRNFGTPLLIVASGLTYATIYRDRSLDPWTFYQKRLARLIFPAWVFLTVFFAFFYVFSKVGGRPLPFSVWKIPETYLFLNGIGFVWILQVYIVLALVTPAALFFSRRVGGNVVYFSCLLAAYFAYEASLPILQSLTTNKPNSVWNTTVFSALPYSILFLYGLRLHRLSTRAVIFIALTCFLAFVVQALVLRHEYGVFVGVQSYKYPPTFYYLAYGMFALNLTYLVCRNVVMPDAVGRVVTWLATNSLWIYLWHIFAYYLWEMLLPKADGSWLLFLSKVSVLFGMGVCATWLQLRATKSVLAHRKGAMARTLATLLS